MNTKNQFHKKFQLLRPCTVFVTGPTESAVATLCIVPTLFVETAFYTIIKAKATSHVYQAYKKWAESSQYEYADDFKVSINCFAKKVKAASDLKWNNADYMLDAKFVTSVGMQNTAAEAYATNVANVYLAMRVQHICDIDSGNVFRDKHGRDAASVELNMATQTLLYYTYAE